MSEPNSSEAGLPAARANLQSAAQRGGEVKVPAAAEREGRVAVLGARQRHHRVLLHENVARKPHRLHFRQVLHECPLYAAILARKRRRLRTNE